MRFIPTKVHGILDYIEGIALIAAPWLFQFQDVGGPAVLLPMILGVGLIVYSLLTNYEVGLMKVLPMQYHLVLDFLAGALLALSPWLFGFADEKINAWLPHVIVGVAVILIVLVSKTQPEGAKKIA